MLEAKIENGRIILSMPFDVTGVTSASGKSKVHASTRGNQTVNVKDGDKSMVLSVGVNVYSKK